MDAATAQAFAQAGTNVMTTARTEKDVNQTAEERTKFGNKVGICVADGMKPSDLETLVKEVTTTSARNSQ